MELLIAAVLGGVVLAFVTMVAIWKVVSAAVDNLLRWLIYNFGNERSATELKKTQEETPSEPPGGE